MVKKGGGRIYSQISSFLHACAKGRFGAALGDTPVCVCENTHICVRGNTRMFVQGRHICLWARTHICTCDTNALGTYAKNALE